MGVVASLEGIVTLLAAASSVVLAAVALAARTRGRLQWSFALGMLGFAAEAVGASVLLTRTELPEARLLWLRVVHVVGFLLPVPWLAFVGRLLTPAATPLPRRWRLAVTGAAGLAIAGAGAVAILPAFLISDLPGPFYAARLEPVGRYGVIGQVVATVAVLAGLEMCLRTSRGAGRWRIKYLVLGLGGVFLVRFYLLSHVLLFHVVMAAYLTTGAGTVLLGNLVVGAALARGGLLGVELTVSRQVLYRSVVVAVLGCYLFVVGALGWMLTRLGIPEELFWGSLAVFLSAVGLAAVLLSEDVRWRIKRFIGLHFYRSKYDYRAQWSQFTHRLGSLVTVDELAPALLAAVIEAVGATRGVLYLAGERDGRYVMAAAVALDRPAPDLAADVPLLARFHTERKPCVIGNGYGAPAEALAPAVADAFPEGAVAVPIHWRGTLTGLMIIGPERAGAPYTTEDLEFLATVGEQAAGAIVTARLSETVAQAREFEAFHRLTSFVVHDLKNSTSALSMLSQNALANFDDPEFQQDALKTLARTVDRMKALLARLSAAREDGPLRQELVDLATLAREAVGPLAGDRRVHLVQDLAPAPRVVGDGEALLRVIQNLLTNAVEALSGEGVVTVKSHPDRDWAVLSVSDTGCGMSETFIRTSLFAPFRSTKKGGWGIGLYQAKGIVEAHEGTIEVASKEGEGTTFCVRLPAAPPPGERDLA